MTMYFCDVCNTAFVQPLKRTVSNSDGDHRWLEEERRCPVCGTEGHFHRVKACPRCDGWMRPGNILCRECRSSLRDRFTAFVGELTAEEADQLDAWLDGDTIQNHERWH